jgi:F-type H+-transporting ATPase subunit delta
MALLHPRRIETCETPCTAKVALALACAGAGKDIGRVDVSEPASISASIAGRYALAIFDLSQEAKGLKALEADVVALEAALAESADLREVISSPMYSRDAQGKAITAVAAKMGLASITANGLALMADKRRLFVLPHLLTALRARIADAKGEMTAEVTAAQALTKAQADKLAATLKKQTGKTVKLKVAVDESLIGGMIVKLGSKMIDTSVASKLASLQNAMKEVG